MTAILPPAVDVGSFEALRRDDPRIVQGVRAIARRHELGDDVPACFPEGSLPVYGLGNRWVVKLYPPCFAHELAIEASALSAVDRRLEIPTPRVEATGELDGWRYLVMSRLLGEPLVAAWPRVRVSDRIALMESLGRALATLHALDPTGLAVPRSTWGTFVREQTASAVERQRARGLGDRWLEQIPAFLVSVSLPRDPMPALLHTEVMREHLLVEETPRGFVLSGLFDFEPAMIGAADYEFASVGVFATCGELSLLRRLLVAYGTSESALDEALSRRFLAYALLHLRTCRGTCVAWRLRRASTRWTGSRRTCGRPRSLGRQRRREGPDSYRRPPPSCNDGRRPAPEFVAYSAYGQPRQSPRNVIGNDARPART